MDVSISFRFYTKTLPILDKVVKYILYLTILSGFLLSLILFYPGFFFFDTSMQYQEFVHKQYTDWHPPIMSIWWHIWPNVGSVFLAHLAIYYIALIFLIKCLSQEKRMIDAIITTLFFLHPLFSFSMLHVLKDSGMLSGWLGCITLLYLQEKNKISGKIMWLFIIPLLIYSASVRHNGIVAAIPLIYYMVLKTYTSKRILVRLVITALLSTSLFAVNYFITYYLYKAENVALDSLIMRCDLSAIECFTNHQYKVPASFFTKPSNEHENRKKLCTQVNPRSCDPLFFSTDDSALFHLPLINRNQYPLIKQQWAHAILTRPFTYLHYRFLMFGQALFHPVWQLGNTKNLWQCPDIGVNCQQCRSYLLHVFIIAVEKMGSMLGVMILIFGLLLFIKIHRGKNNENLARYTLYSAFLYGFVCIFLMPAVEARYFLWFYAGTFMAIIFYCSENKNNSKKYS